MIRGIHPFGPKPGQYRPAAETDIRVTLKKARQKLELEEFAPFSDKDREEIDAQDYLEGKR
jgi:hypothetical protein